MTNTPDVHRMKWWVAALGVAVLVAFTSGFTVPPDPDVDGTLLDAPIVGRTPPSVPPADPALSLCLRARLEWLQTFLPTPTQTARANIACAALLVESTLFTAPGEEE